VENRSEGILRPKHGLSLHIETEKHKFLFDLGPDNTLFENAKKKNIDLTEIDTVIISHGHKDHGGALQRFLHINSKAKIYVQRRAFEPHYSRFLFFKVNIGLDRHFENHPQVILVDGDMEIDEELSLFIINNNSKCYSNANNPLYEGYQKDYFKHEQNLVIREKQTQVQFYTCHCTGKKAYDYLASKLPNMHYLFCGNTI